MLLRSTYQAHTAAKATQLLSVRYPYLCIRPHGAALNQCDAFVIPSLRTELLEPYNSPLDPSAKRPGDHLSNIPALYEAWHGIVTSQISAFS